MNTSEASPFQRSNKVNRSPNRPPVPPPEPPVIFTPRPPTPPPQPPTVPNESGRVTRGNPSGSAKLPQKPQILTPRPIPRTIITTNKHTTMNAKDIQQSIISFVPEFDGNNRANGLTRFLATADTIFDTLTTDNERSTFVSLIKLRLTGDAYMRMSHRQANDYTSFKAILSNMYAKTFSLIELERNYTDVRQNYGESIRNYGYRLIEALEQYKNGYKSKYNVKQIDKAYTDHLEATAIQAFKTGLNNTILREKMATYKADNMDSIIDETELIEKMLMMTSRDTHQEQIPQARTNTQTTQDFRRKPPQIVCNYCGKPNHTWDACRTRQNIERRSSQRTYHQPNHTNGFNATPQNFNRRYPQETTINRQPPHHQNQQNFNRQPKYCSHCKVTTGHTFAECRSKFQPPRYHPNNSNNPYSQRNPNNSNNFNNSNNTRQTATNDQLTDMFNNMRINTIHQPQHQYPYTTNSGNANGSDQR